MKQSIGALLGDLIPWIFFLYLTLVLFNIIKPKKKPTALQNPPKYYKPIVLIGLIGFSALLVMDLIK